MTQVADVPGLAAVLEGTHRSAAHRARDAWRHPRETFAFFGLRPDMTIVDIWPGSAGWTTEILAPFLRNRGTYYAASYDVATEDSFDPRGSQEKFLAKLAARPDLYDRVIVSKASQKAFDLAPPASADMIVFFRLAHVFARNDALEPLLRACLAVLKPGGVLAFKDHRARPGQPIDPQGRNGYLDQNHCIARVTAQGFAFAGATEINANPHDTADHPLGVWNLPPWLWGGETDRDKYVAIGESDRMTLKFVKP